MSLQDKSFIAYADLGIGKGGCPQRYEVVRLTDAEAAVEKVQEKYDRLRNAIYEGDLSQADALGTQGAVRAMHLTLDGVGAPPDEYPCNRIIELVRRLRAGHFWEVGRLRDKINRPVVPAIGVYAKLISWGRAEYNSAMEGGVISPGTVKDLVEAVESLEAELATLKAQNEQQIQIIAMYQGEGNQQLPEEIEWRTLAAIPKAERTDEQRQRLKWLANDLRRRDEAATIAFRSAGPQEGSWDWALAEMKAGKRLTHGNLIPGSYIGLQRTTFLLYLTGRSPARLNLDITDFERTDWQIVAEPAASGSEEG